MTLVQEGDDAIVRTYSTSDPTETTGEFESPDDTVTETETKALFQRIRRHRIERDPSGEEVELDMTVYVEDDVEVHDTDTARRPSEIERVPTGEVFRVEAVVRESGGITRCECIRH